MAEDKDRDTRLPVTGEVGSEGGSFADATSQVSTFEGDIHTAPGRGGASSSATQATRSDQVRGTAGAAADAPASGVVRYPTEPPHPPSATEGRRTGGMDWKTGLVGAAAGAAVAMAVSRLRRRTKSTTPPEVDCETVIVAITDEPS
jgi:hypothetical protein